MLRVGKKTSWTTAAVAAFMALLLACGGFAAASEGKFIYDSKGRRSPFLPPIVEGHGEEEENIPDDQETIDRIRGMLTGVLWDEKKPIAFMAGAESEVVEKGAVIEGWRIVDITRKGIVIQKGERMVDLQIHEDE